MPEISQLHLDILENLVLDRIETLAAMRERDAAFMWEQRLRDIFGKTVTGDYVQTKLVPVEKKSDGEQGELL